MAHADLTQLDARMILAHQIHDQLAEINARGRGEIEDELAAIVQAFHIHQLHVQSAVHDASAAELPRVTAELFVLRRLGKFLRSGRAGYQKLTAAYRIGVSLPFFLGLSRFLAPVVGFKAGLDAVTAFQRPGGG